MSTAAPKLGPEALGDDSSLDDALAGFIVDAHKGTAICAPERVPLAGRATVPLVGCRIISLREAAQWPPFEEMAVLLASQIETGRVFVAPAFAQGTEASNRPPPPPDPGEGCTGTSFRIDLSGRLGLPREPGRFAIWLIARDEVSGPIPLELAKPPQYGYEDPEVAKFIATWRASNIPQRRGADPATVWPRESVFGSYPSYRTSAESPPTPKLGISLWAKRVMVMEKGARWVLACSYRLAIPRSHVVLTPVSGDPATAVLPMAIVVTARQSTGFYVQRLRVPSKSPIGPVVERPLVEGHFTLNLFSLPGIWRTPNTYYLHVVCGDTLSGPAVSSLVSHDMLVGEA